MKKKFYFATLVIAALSFTGCANDEYVGDQRNLGEQNGAIAFSTKSTNTVRAENSADADKLHKQFWVYGTKTVRGTETPVFKDYKVVYDDGSKSPSNTTGWEYVGIEGTPQTQTIKYWDYSASQYDFEAYSKTTGSVARNDAGDYEVTQLSSPKDLYFAEKKTVTKSDNNYKDAVQLNFKSVLSKIRVGFYETIPGYSVKIDRFYRPNNTENPSNFEDASNQAATNFVAWCPNKAANTDHPFVVTYVTANTSNPAVTTPTVTKVKDGSNYLKIDGTDGYTLNPQLTLGTNLLTQNQIGETSSAVTWDNIDGESNPIYTYFIPQNQLGEGKVKEMKIKVDYTLTSDDNSGEKIEVKGATATVPADYVKWAANTAYTYIFKISDNTNGTTGDPSQNDPAGLYPITFDAAVVDMDERTYLTTVSTPSVTVSQDGTNFVNPGGLKFKTGTPIELKVTDSETGSIIDGAQITGGYINVDYKYDKTPEQNLSENGGGINNSVTLTQNKLVQQGTAGYWVLKVAVSKASGAAFTYVIIRVGAAEQGPANS